MENDHPILGPQAPERQPGMSVPVSPVDPDDMELPDLPAESTREAPKEEDEGPVPPPPSGSFGRAVKGGLAALALLVGYLVFFRSPVPVPPHGDETAYANWKQYVEPVTAKWKAGEKVAEVVNAGGAVQFVSTLTLPDRDPATTRAVTEALSKGDDRELEKLLKGAQDIPVLKDSQGQPLPRKEPEVTPAMKKEILERQPEFVRLVLFDSCDEDGDVVEVLINGQSFAVVPLTHQGATLSIPVPAGGARLALRGVRDGVGRITVGGRSSAGDVFWAAMEVGEVLELNCQTR
jgi:hypothetical protein